MRHRSIYKIVNPCNLEACKLICFSEIDVMCCLWMHDSGIGMSRYLRLLTFIYFWNNVVKVTVVNT